MKGYFLITVLLGLKEKDSPKRQKLNLWRVKMKSFSNIYIETTKKFPSAKEKPESFNKMAKRMGNKIEKQRVQMPRYGKTPLHIVDLLPILNIWDFFRTLQFVLLNSHQADIHFNFAKILINLGI